MRWRLQQILIRRVGCDRFWLLRLRLTRLLHRLRRASLRLRRLDRLRLRPLLLLLLLNLLLSKALTL